MPPSPPSAQQKADFDYVSLASIVIVSWELLVHFFMDVSYLRIPGWYRRPVVWAYFFQRYGAFITVLAEANIRLGRPSNCHAFGLVSLIVGGVFVLPSVSLIYLYRVLAIWNKRPAVKYTLIVLWVILLGASFTAPFSQSATNLPTGGCIINRSEIYAPASFIANAIYDGVVFFLTLIKLGANRSQYKHFHSPVQTVLLKDGILYFAVSVIVGITDIVFLEAFKSPTLASTVIPLHIALTSVMTTRLVNNVFNVVHASKKVHYISNSNSSWSDRNPAGAVSDTTQPSQSRVHPPTLLPTFIIGSGVGTDSFEETNKKLRRDCLGDPGMAIGSGKELSGSHHTYAIPMQIRSPMSPSTPSSASISTSGVHVDTEQAVF